MIPEIGSLGSCVFHLFSIRTWNVHVSFLGCQSSVYSWWGCKICWPIWWVATSSNRVDISICGRPICGFQKLFSVPRLGYQTHVGGGNSVSSRKQQRLGVPDLRSLRRGGIPWNKAWVLAPDGHHLTPIVPFPQVWKPTKKIMPSSRDIRMARNDFHRFPAYLKTKQKPGDS